MAPARLALTQALAQGILEADRPAMLFEEIAKNLVGQFAEILAEVIARQLDG